MELKAFRRARLKDACAAQGIDVLLASLPENITYVTGGYVSVNQYVLCSTETYVIYVPAEDRVIYVAGHGEIPSIREFEGPDAEIWNYGSFRFWYNESFAERAVYDRAEKENYGSSAEALCTALKSVAAPGCRVGIDYSRVPFAVSSYLQANLGAEMTDALSVFNAARIIKHPEEQAGIEYATEVADYGLWKALEVFRPGDSEKDLENSFIKYIAEKGGQEIFFVATANLRAAFSDTSDRPDAAIPVGSMIRFDYGAKVGGYTSDLARTVCVGRPDPKVAALYDAIKAGLDAAIDMVKPGVKACDIFHKAMEVTRASGLPAYRRHHVGHGIGLEVYDKPSFAPSDATELQENMVINLETPYYELGWGGVQLEDTMAVTADGARLFDKSSRDLIVLDF